MDTIGKFIGFMREIGVQGSGHRHQLDQPMGSKKAMLACDYDEQHEYWDGPLTLWRNGVREFSNQSMTCSVDNRLAKFVMGGLWTGRC